MLDVVHGDIWSEYLRRSDVNLVIPTNGSVRGDGCAVMGRGLALQAARRFPGIPRLLGETLRTQYSLVYSPPPFLATLPHRLIAFPVKWRWPESADLELIGRSAEELALWLRHQPEKSVVMPCVGCGNGRLTWGCVRPRLEALDAYDIACRVRVIDTAAIR